jgi:hypothetical protein
VFLKNDFLQKRRRAGLNGGDGMHSIKLPAIFLPLPAIIMCFK